MNGVQKTKTVWLRQLELAERLLLARIAAGESATTDQQREHQAKVCALQAKALIEACMQ